jgi:hypothetical protein
MNPPIVYELTIPRSHNTSSSTRIVINIQGASFGSGEPYPSRHMTIQEPFHSRNSLHPLLSPQFGAPAEEGMLNLGHGTAGGAS